MVKKYFEKDIEKISADKLKSMVGKIKVKKEEGQYEELAGSGLKKYMKGVVRGGKTLTSIERKLKTSGVVLSQAGRRQRLMKLVGGDKPSSSQLKTMEKAEVRRRAGLARQAKASAELIEGRNDPLYKVFRGQKTETSERIGVAHQAGEASALSGQTAGDGSQASIQSVSVGATIGEAVGVNPQAQGDDNLPNNGEDGSVPTRPIGGKQTGLAPGLEAVAPQSRTGNQSGPKPIAPGQAGLRVSNPSGVGGNKPAANLGKSGRNLTFGVGLNPQNFFRK